MKTIYLSAVLLTPFAAAQTTIPTGNPSMPLSGHVLLFAESGQQLGELTSTGMLFTGQKLSEVTTIRVLPSDKPTNYLLSGKQFGEIKLDGYGPQGQRVTYTLPSLKTVTWISTTGRITTLSYQ